MRIDMHVHYMPPSVKDDKEWFSREPFLQLLVEESDGKSVQGWASAERMLEDMNAAGIDRAVIQGEYFQTHENCVRRNSMVLDAIRHGGGRLIAFAAIQPKAEQLARDELRRCLDNGMKGVGEISPYAQGFSLTDPEFLRLAEACVENGIPLLLHTNDEVGRYYKGKVPIPVREYYDLAARFPELRLILAHWGGGLFLHEIVPLVRTVLRNVFYDTAASPLLYPTGSIFRAALACIPPSKILYASDYPLVVYPRKQSRPDFSRFLNEISALNLGGETERAILGENAARLLFSNMSDSRRESTVLPDVGNAENAVTSRIDEAMSVSLIASTFPQTRAIFERFGIEWQGAIAVLWEPLRQTAAAHGLNASKTSVLLSELNDAIR